MKKYLLLLIFLLPVVAFCQSLSFDDLITKFDDQYESASYDQALKTAIEAIEKAEDDFGENSIEYATALHRRGVIALMLGDLPKTKSSFDNSLEVLKGISKDNSPLAAKVLSGLSIYYDYSDDFYSAEKCLKKALDIYKAALGAKSFEYIKTLEELGNFYWDFNQYPKANEIYKENYDVIMSLYNSAGSKNIIPDYSLMVLNYATLLKEQYDYEMMISILKDALKLAEFTKGKKHPDYRMVNDEIISANILNGLKDNIDSLVIQSISSWSAELDDLEYESEQEKMFTLDYMTQNADIFYTYGLNQKEANKYIIGDIFNFRTSTKGVVLESTYGFRNRLMNSHDESVIQMYDELKSLKQAISNAYSMTGNERVEKNINLDSLEKASRTLEMYIGNSLKDSDKQWSAKSVRWEDIKQNLKEGETAIDFINFVNIRKKPYDSSYNASDIIYCAFVITADSEIPEMIRLTSSAELEAILSNENVDVYLNEPSATSRLYDLIISPLEKYLTNTKKLYISPSGILNRVSFASLKNNRGEYLIDNFDIVYCSNLSEIIPANSNPEGSSFKDAVLFGSIQYDLDSTEYVNLSVKTRGENSVEYESGYEFDSEFNSLINARSVKSGGWNFLPGTTSEIQQISDELKMNSADVKLFSGNEATEGAFKNLSGNNSPSLIHVSTHGFFFPDPYANLNYTEKEEMSKRQTSSKGVFRKSMNSLMRSGLILAGANLLWRDGKRIEGTEDGILTAHEVSTLNLFNTDLVILSACESGLGDIKNNEGVIGLQRAFKIAGAKHIIMSLWKVPDQETAILMETFYKYLFREHLTVREAFVKAQKDLRVKYSDPYFWSAFILI